MIATLRDNGLVFAERMPLFCDSTSAISVGKNPCLHSRSKHIDVRFHFLRDQYKKGVIDLIHVDTDDQLADTLTKPLEEKPFTRLQGVRSSVSLLVRDALFSLVFPFVLVSLVLFYAFCSYHVMHHCSYLHLYTCT